MHEVTLRLLDLELQFPKLSSWLAEQVRQQDQDDKGFAGVGVRSGRDRLETLCINCSRRRCQSMHRDGHENMGEKTTTDRRRQTVAREGVIDRTQAWDSDGSSTDTGHVTRRNGVGWGEKALGTGELRRESTGVSTRKDRPTEGRKTRV